MTRSKQNRFRVQAKNFLKSRKRKLVATFLLKIEEEKNNSIIKPFLPPNNLYAVFVVDLTLSVSKNPLNSN